MPEKNVTNEDLARMIAEGFASTATKRDFEELSSRMDGFDEKMDGFDARMDGFDERLGIVETKLDKALYREFERVDKLEKRVSTIEGKIGLS